VKRRAALSAFGFSGTNAHLVIEEAPSGDPADGKHDHIAMEISTVA
jgi:acyl transferase domain-containing protein